MTLPTVGPGAELEPGDTIVGGDGGVHVGLGDGVAAGVWKYRVLEIPLQPALLWACIFQRYLCPYSNTPLGIVSEVPYTTCGL